MIENKQVITQLWPLSITLRRWTVKCGFSTDSNLKRQQVLSRRNINLFYLHICLGAETHHYE